MYEIVANWRNGIDVDKFDYMPRDALNAGVKTTFDYSRLMNFSRVIDNQICYHAKEVFNIYELFHTRYTLFKQVYTHRAAKAIEYMIRDALIEADVAWDRRLSKAIESPEQYMTLTDCILKEIEISKEPSLLKARDIVKSIRCRNLYRFVDEYIIPDDLTSHLPKIKAADITSFNPVANVMLEPDDLIVHDGKINYGYKDKNPVDNTRFFKSSDPTNSFSIKKNKVSYLIPSRFEERIVRVYSKVNDAGKINAAAKAFRAFLRSKCTSAGSKQPISPIPSSSSRVRLQQFGFPLTTCRDNLLLNYGRCACLTVPFLSFSIFNHRPPGVGVVLS
jgi:HD superfamily phosphohydrolase